MATRAEKSLLQTVSITAEKKFTAPWNGKTEYHRRQTPIKSLL